MYLISSNLILALEYGEIVFHTQTFRTIFDCMYVLC